MYRIRNKANGQWLAVSFGGIVQVSRLDLATTWTRYGEAEAVADAWERAWDDAPEVCDPEIVEGIKE